MLSDCYAAAVVEHLSKKELEDINADQFEVNCSKESEKPPNTFV